MATPSSSLIDQLFRTVETIGIERTDQILQEAQFKGIVYTNKDVEFVVKTIAKGFQIPEHEIYFGIGRKNDRKWAIGFCVHYLTVVFEYETDDVADFINKEFSLCHKYSKLVDEINPKHYVEARYAELKTRFDLQITKPKK